jgi:hypothetical protein
MKDFFDTSEKIESAVSNFKNLLNASGWKIFVEIVEANMDVVKDRILTGVEGETKEEIDRLRDKLKVYEEVINTPQNMINKFISSDTEVPDVDPYETMEDLNQRRKNKEEEEKKT